jgi:hypothetical protein
LRRVCRRQPSRSHRVARFSDVLIDTINRTLRSKLLMIKLFQDWKATAFMEPNLHDHRITYGDLGRGLRIRESRDRSGLYAGTAVKPLRPS